MAVLSGVTWIDSKSMTVLVDIRERDKEIRKEAFVEIYNKIEEGMCHECEHKEERCFKKCGDEGWEKETILKWLEGKINDIDRSN